MYYRRNLSFRDIRLERTMDNNSFSPSLEWMKLTTCAIKTETIMQIVATDSLTLICFSLVFCSVSVLVITCNML